ncbi:MAG: hypothetical protein AAB676_14115, partial [Verrucomicrobiota bacterium]
LAVELADEPSAPLPLLVHGPDAWLQDQEAFLKHAERKGLGERQTRHTLQSVPPERRVRRGGVVVARTEVRLSALALQQENHL